MPLPTEPGSESDWLTAVRDMAGGDLAGVRVTCLGAPFESDSAAAHHDPAPDIARALHLEGAVVTVFDPEAKTNAPRLLSDRSYAPSAVAALIGADVVVLLTAWQQFRDLDPNEISRVVSHRRIVDGRHALDPDDYRAKGWQYRALGLPVESSTVDLAADLHDEVPA